MKHIAMLLSNPFRPDPRVLKEARTLNNAGYHITVLCWDRKGEFLHSEQLEGIQIRRYFIHSGYSSGSRQTLYLPRFWIRAYYEMSNLVPDIVHCHDLDTTIPAYIYARVHHIPWIYDAHECYPEQIRPQVHRLIYKSLIQLENFISPKATYVITVGDLIAERFQSLGARTEIIGNYPELDTYRKQPHTITRSTLEIPSQELIVAYIGGFTQAREILPLLETSNLVPGTTILLAGDGPQRPEIEAALPRFNKVHYLGWISPELVPVYTSLADVIYYGLNISDGNSQYSSPNALYNAMAAGKPILSTDVGEIALIINKIKCGLVIPKPTPEYIASAILQFKNADLRNQMANNARAAAANTYNWEQNRDKLLNIYREL